VGADWRSRSPNNAAPWGAVTKEHFAESGLLDKALLNAPAH
jgi:hypothetical protein